METTTEPSPIGAARAILLGEVIDRENTRALPARYARLLPETLLVITLRPDMASELTPLAQTIERDLTDSVLRHGSLYDRSYRVQLRRSEDAFVDELFGGAKAAPKARKAAGPRKAAKKVAPKYRNPANAKETWTGRGKQPRWMAALTAKGKKPEDFLIK